MKVTPLAEDDPARLLELAGSQPKALQRDRYRAVLLAMQGHDGQELQGDQIAAMLGRSPRFVDEWVGRYRVGGLSNLSARKQRGNKPALSPAQLEAFRTRLLAGPTEADGGVCTLRGRDAQRILAVEMGVPLKLSAVYDWMHRGGLSCLKPRPRHRKNNPQAMEAFRKSAPLLSKR